MRRAGRGGAASRRPAALALVLALAAPAAGNAQVPGLYPQRWGEVGVHGLTDTAAPGATCRFALPLDWSLGETWLQVRPPVVYARDRGEGEDRQAVGWRAVVWTYDPAAASWIRAVAGPEERLEAGERRGVPFDDRGPGASFSLPFAIHAVAVEIAWHAPDGTVEGTVRRPIAYYAIAVRDRTETRPRGVDRLCRPTGGA